MAKKVNERKFTIGFSSEIDGHIFATEMLNSQGRNKAAYIANAICFYEEYKENNIIEKTVMYIMEKYGLNSIAGYKQGSSDYTLQDNEMIDNLISDSMNLLLLLSTQYLTKKTPNKSKDDIILYG